MKLNSQVFGRSWLPKYIKKKKRRKERKCCKDTESAGSTPDGEEKKWGMIWGKRTYLNMSVILSYSENVLPGQCIWVLAAPLLILPCAHESWKPAQDNLRAWASAPGGRRGSSGFPDSAWPVTWLLWHLGSLDRNSFFLFLPSLSLCHSALLVYIYP